MYFLFTKTTTMSIRHSIQAFYTSEFVGIKPDFCENNKFSIIAGEEFNRVMFLIYLRDFKLRFASF